MIQGASGATILACGMSLLSVAASGAGQMKAITLWGAASAAGRRARPAARRRARRHDRLAGPVLDRRGDRGRLHPADAAHASQESRDPDKPRSIDYAGTVLVALTLGPARARAQRGQRLGLGVGGHARLPGGRDRGAASLFVGVERRVKAPLVDLAPAAQPGARRRDAGDPHRRGHDQRADVRAEPVLPEPRRARVERLRGRARDAARGRRHDRHHAGDHAARGEDRRRAGRSSLGFGLGDRRLRRARVRAGVVGVLARSSLR